MRTALIFLYSLFLLMSGDIGVYAHTESKTGFQSHHIYENRQIRQNCTPVTDSIINKNEFVINDDVEDEDGNDYTSGKVKPASYCFYQIISYWDSIYFSKSFKAPPATYRAATPLFILHRVFRI